MPYPIARAPLSREQLNTHDIVPGDWWWAEYLLNEDGSPTKLLGRHYHAHNTHRMPIVVVLPGGIEFCVDMVTSAELSTGGEGWRVWGDPRDGTLSVSPSINCVGSYHGWLGTSGTPLNTLSDDLEGRAQQHADYYQRAMAKRAQLGLAPS